MKSKTISPGVLIGYRGFELWVEKPTSEPLVFQPICDREPLRVIQTLRPSLHKLTPSRNEPQGGLHGLGIWNSLENVQSKLEASLVRPRARDAIGRVITNRISFRFQPSPKNPSKVLTATGAATRLPAEP